jgi:hypothetical protein
MIIDLYFACWDNADILPFFFRHYDRFVRHYVALDDGSTDGSLDILSGHARVEIGKMPRAGPDEAHSTIALPLAETIWRERSKDADWVIMCDVDEHLYHSDLLAYLAWCKDEGTTIIPALGYQMLSDTLPKNGLLCEQVIRGAPFKSMSKLNVFSPRDVERLNYAPGRHSAAPTGNIVAPDRDELMNLHYKYLDFERVMRRHAACATRLTGRDVERKAGHRWLFTRDELRADWQEFDARAVDIRGECEPWHSHTEPRWWNHYRRPPRQGDDARVGHGVAIG